ncbi:hypothetical protein ACFLT7_07575, partial [candidate division KSB1 bacterium]
EPAAKDWILRDRNGHGIKIAYGHYFWRYLPDIRNPDYLEWYKETLIRYCMENVKPKFIWLDNVAENAPVDWQPLHNKYWVEGFRQHLRETYSPAELTEMLGYPTINFIEPPYWVWGSNVVVNDPIMQRWIDFRCKSVNDAITEVCGFIKSIDPGCAIGINIHGMSRNNRAITGIDPIGVCDGTGVDGWGGESSVIPELTDDGAMISPIREFKAARTLKLAYTSGGRSSAPLATVVTQAFSYRHQIPGTGYLGNVPAKWGKLAGPEPRDTWYEHEEYYRDTETIADVAILRSYPSLAYNSGAPLQSTIGFEQTLIQAKVPFDVIFEKNLKNLSKYKVLVLANTECMSDGDVKLIGDYVRRGGGLVATGSASLYTEWRRPRPNFGLADVLDLTPEEAEKTRRGYRISDAMSTWIGVEGIQTKMTEFGKGRAVYVPRVIPSYTGSAPKMILPVNWPELIRAVKWAAGQELSINVHAPLTVVMNLYEKKEKKQLLLHLVNFKQDLIGDIGVDLKIPDGKKVKSVTVLTPDSVRGGSIKHEQSGDRLAFRVPELKLYDMAVIQLN